MKFAIILSLIILSSCSKNNQKEQNQVPSNSDEVISFNAGVGVVTGTADYGIIKKTDSKIFTFSIKNTGDAALVGPPSLDNANFAIVYQNGCSSISPTKSCSIKVSFDAKGKNPGQVYSSNLNLDSAFIALTAQVEPDPVVVLEESLEYLSGTTVITEQDFGEVAPKQSILKNIIIKNKGTAPLSSNVVLSGATAFSVTYDACSGKSIAKGSSCQIKINLSSGTLSGQILGSISYNGKNLALKAAVLVPLAASSPSTTNPSAPYFNVASIYNNIESTIINAGTLIGTESKQLIISFKNLGNFAAPVSSPLIDNANASIVYNQCQNISLQPSASCQVRVLVAASGRSVGLYSSNLSYAGKNLPISYQVNSAGAVITYEPTYSEYGACSAALACSGSGTKSRTMSSCQKLSNGSPIAGGQLSDCSSFSIPANLTASCNSPAGNKTVSVSNGNQVVSCLEGSTSQSFVSVSCFDQYVAQGQNCVAVTPVDCSGNLSQGTLSFDKIDPAVNFSGATTVNASFIRNPTNNKCIIATCDSNLYKVVNNGLNCQYSAYTVAVSKPYNEGTGPKAGLISTTYNSLGTILNTTQGNTSIQVPEGSSITFTAIPETGYEFDHWSGASSCEGSMIPTCTVSNSSYPSAYFRMTRPFIKLKITGNGKVTDLNTNTQYLSEEIIYGDYWSSTFYGNAQALDSSVIFKEWRGYCGGNNSYCYVDFYPWNFYGGHMDLEAYFAAPEYYNLKISYTSDQPVYIDATNKGRNNNENNALSLPYDGQIIEGSNINIGTLSGTGVPYEVFKVSTIGSVGGNVLYGFQLNGNVEIVVNFKAKCPSGQYRDQTSELCVPAERVCSQGMPDNAVAASEIFYQSSEPWLYEGYWSECQITECQPGFGINQNSCSTVFPPVSKEIALFKDILVQNEYLTSNEANLRNPIGNGSIDRFNNYDSGNRMVMNSDKTKAYTWVFREVEVPYFYEDGLKMDIALIEMDVVQKATTIITTSSALGITNRDSNSSKMARTGEYLFFTNNNLAFKMNMTTKVITAVSELAGTTLNGNIGSKIIFTKSSPVGLFVANEDGSVSQVSSVSNIPNYSAGLNIDSQAVEGSLLDNYGYGVVKNNKAYISVNGSLSVIDLSTMNLSVLVNSDVLKILTVDGNNVVITKKTSIPYPWCNQCGSMDVISGIMTYNLTSQQSSTVVNFQYSQYESSMSDNSFVVIGRELYFGGAVIQNTTSVGSELYKLNLDTMAISLVFDREGSREAQNWNTGETDIVQYSSQPYNFVKDSNGMGYATMQTGDNEYKVVKLDGSLTTIITDGSIIYAFYPLTENKMFFATRYQSSFKYIQEDQVLSGGGYNGASVSLNDKFFIMNGNILMKNDYSDPNGQRLSGRYFFRIKY